MSTGRVLYSPSTGRALYSPSTGRALYSGVSLPIKHYTDYVYISILRDRPVYLFDDSGKPRPAVRSDFFPNIYSPSFRIRTPSNSYAKWHTQSDGGSYGCCQLCIVHDMTDFASFNYLRAISIDVTHFNRPSGSGQPLIGVMLSNTLTLCTSLSCMAGGETHAIDGTGILTWYLPDLPIANYLFLYQWIDNFEPPTSPDTNVTFSIALSFIRMHLI